MIKYSLNGGKVAIVVVNRPFPTRKNRMRYLFDAMALGRNPQRHDIGVGLSVFGVHSLRIHGDREDILSTSFLTRARLRQL